MQKIAPSWKAAFDRLRPAMRFKLTVKGTNKSARKMERLEHPPRRLAAVGFLAPIVINA
jgi:hypothetical protein